MRRRSLSSNCLHPPNKVVDFSSYFFLEGFFTAEGAVGVGNAHLGLSSWHTSKGELNREDWVDRNFGKIKKGSDNFTPEAD